MYGWAGGQEALARMINAFYDRVEGDELLAPLFGGAVTAEHRDHVIAWWSEVAVGAARSRARPVIGALWAQSCVQAPHLHAASQARTTA